MRFLLIATIACLTTPAFAAQPAPSSTRALGQMVGECQQREAVANDAKYASEDQVEALKSQLASEKKRADEAEAKLKDLAPNAK